jgi:4-amino-4-deoxy-L-arabinose transferase-like glycosyltransferase
MGALLCLTFVLRLAATWSLPIEPLYPDYAEYRQLARNLVEHGSFGFGSDWREDPELAGSPWCSLYEETATARPPGYPALLAGQAHLWGPSPRGQQLLHVAAESVNAVLLFSLAGQLGGAAAGWFAWALWMLCPRGYLYSMQIIREPFIALAVILSVMCLISAVRERRALYGLLAGACVGLGAYVKETVILLCVPYGVWLLWLMYRRPSERRPLAWSAVALLACAAVLPLPWIARNSALRGRLTGFTTLGWYNVQKGVLPPGWLSAQPAPVQARLDVERAPDAFAADRIYRDRVLTYLSADPWGAARAMLMNAFLFISPAPRELVLGRRSIGLRDTISIAYNVTVLSLAALGFWWARSDEMWLFLIAFLFFWAVHGAFVGSPRFRYPVDVFLTLAAAIACGRLWQRVRRLAPTRKLAPQAAGQQHF